MKKNILNAEEWRIVVICLFALLPLSGCGDIGSVTGTSGGGTIVAGVGTGGTGVIKSAHTVSATGSGLIGAIVFVDKNGNRLPDPGEPFTLTDQEGAYSLVSDGSEGIPYPLLIQAVEGKTIIKATGQLVTSSYVVNTGQ